MNKQLRELALEILDDEDGVSNDAWAVLAPMLVENGDQDIIEAIDGCDGRVYLPENHGITL